ncbi:transcriptional activator DEMETER [Diospyros lotus]|uniref:transcriptional activator DEMETER n=1 Tax=Diospyros lotus TaxID=55363 RepID=UPI002257F07E|nr:transcriptional activator DEMETER [Diospyros lotus]XP_052199093.1 transcriptional activator DEMETER [Diospyros lotus]XP_052199094.1 transcriptional activator DEMETER [Diospyros lotus]XP_052199095.1 transcriptional activator DEMETER [Diospyros lotus]
MNSRNSGKGFLVRTENGVPVGGGAPWVPLTPGKPILSGSTVTPADRQGNLPGRMNCYEVAGLSAGGHLQPAMNYNGGVQHQRFDLLGLIGQSQNSGSCGFALSPSPAENRRFGPSVGSYPQTFRNDGAAWDNNPLAEVFSTNYMVSMAPANGASNRNVYAANSPAILSSYPQVDSSWDKYSASANGTSITKMLAANTPTILNSYTQVDSSWTKGNFTNLLLGNEICDLDLSQPTVAGSSPLMANGGLPVPFRPNYNLNSPQRSEADATSSTTNSLAFTPVTPDHAKQFDNHPHSELWNFSVVESSSQEKDKLENLLTFTGIEAVANNCNELLQNIVDSSSAAISTQKENGSEGGNSGIDLNKTPQPKTPKRRKHRPKVIVEGKPKRTPTPKTPKNTNSSANPSGKRKYVRKKGLESTETQQADATRTGSVQPSGKRKYVRKKGLDAAATQQVDADQEVVPASESNAKSCRKRLNFDLEYDKMGANHGEAADLQVDVHQENPVRFNLNLDSQATERTGIDSIAVENAVEESAEVNIQSGYTAAELPAGSYSLANSVNQTPPEILTLPERCNVSVAPTAINKLNVIARNMRNASQCKTSNKNSQSQVHQCLQGEVNRNPSQGNTTPINVKETGNITWQTTLHMVGKDERNSNQKGGSKREYYHAFDQEAPSCQNQMASPVCQESNSYNFGTRFLETQKKMRTENGFHPIVSSAPYAAVVKDGPRQIETESNNGVCVNANISLTKGGIPVSYLDSDKTFEKLTNRINSNCVDERVHYITAQTTNIQKHLAARELHLTADSMAQKRTQVHKISSLSGMSSLEMLSTRTKNCPTSGYEQGIEVCRTNVSVNSHNTSPTSSKWVSSCTNKVLLEDQKDASPDHWQSSREERDHPDREQYLVEIDKITCRLQGLSITDKSKEKDGQQQNALVPYKGDGTMVPYKGSDQIKKHRPRAKVDLDPETNRIWNLLMGKEGGEATKAVDNEKWWEEERKVFQGRADSFIARMHLVQGDRRFSRWKGSVVDSVIGVFLTQNVSDHLSSSAFMSLAARFPIQSTTTDKVCHKSGISILAEVPEIQVPDTETMMNHFGNLVRQSVYSQSSVTYCESIKPRTEDPTQTTGRTSLATEHNSITEEKASSSQNSSDSFILQTNGEIHSCSGSNSEAEDSASRGKSNKIHYSPLLHMRGTDSFQVPHSPVSESLCFDDRPLDWHIHSEYIDKRVPRLGEPNNLKNSSSFIHPIDSNSPQMQGAILPPNCFHFPMSLHFATTEVDCSGMLKEESISSLTSSRRIGDPAERLSKTSVQQDGAPMNQASIFSPHAHLTKHMTPRENSFQTVPDNRRDKICVNSPQQDKSGAYKLENALVKEVRPTEAVNRRQSITRHQVPDETAYTGQAFGMEGSTVVSKDKLLKTKAIEANAKEQAYSSGETTTGTSRNLPNTRKGKTEGEKRKSFDWESLRKFAQHNDRRKERTKDQMDSLNYESVRCADVNEISNSIRERGMNNMLAERIKDFLNRLVREHGSIDLEWLRDVPPDKAKDYLLSIRGLGLKSVECVRLLTLHHVAFPVDTNVGRIAVRLGWVPLQPLPESLQLHLLELYPVLESIQKYLWPRLCKLDQRTLYELHYQMITFGKVFCTKSKPNCNACPMRGECRHFASAFASARLALPGPEVKSVVSSTIPTATPKSAAVTIKHMPLPPASSSEAKETGLVVTNCEPIVEEPATPEPEITEVTESDIEDAFYEDPDEIPTIKLNIEEFTLNLHQYMQENMELQGSDMSKALVALDPEAASIPTPKLKNVSRLRTEHQVYELPDSHPLLKGLNTREPDDPSPYLLAIWTPGETANSIQPPESRCGTQESGKLCNEKTCFACNSVREANSLTVRGTLLIPCRTAMRGSFPLNGTYFQVNEVFADHESSLNPIDVPRAWLWNLPRRTVYFGTSVSTIFKGLTTEGIQYCFWRGFVCVRGFDQKTRGPRPLMARLHFPASKLVKTKK